MARAACYRPSPLQHGGTAQTARALAALSPDTIPIDGRRIADLVAMLGRYARLIAYYDADNAHVGDWRALVRSDLSFAIAEIARRDWRPVGATFDTYLDQLRGDLSPQNLKTVYDIVLSLFQEIDALLRSAPPATPLADALRTEIAGRLRTDLARLIAYYRGGVNEALVDAAHQVDASGEAFVFRPAADVIGARMHRLWADGDDWTNWVAGIAADPSIYVGATPADRITHALSHVTAIYRRAYEALIRTITGASDLLDFSLRKYPSHQPHVALLLSFLELYGVQQTALNRFSRNHLDHYFRTVLSLRALPARPDRIHLVADLAKHVQSHLIPNGTEVRAGKDATGIERIYVTGSDFVATQARVVSLRSIFISDDPATGGVFDAPVANSADGLGAELDPDNPAWRPFGEPQPSSGPATMQRSRIGWAVASPLLRMAEGEREIELQFLADPGSPLGDLTGPLTNWFRMSLTGASGWVTAPKVTARVVSTGTGPALILTATLDPDIEPIVDIDPDLHAGGLDTPFPALRIYLNGAEAGANVHARLRDVRFTAAQVTVTAAGVRQLVLQNDLGPLDPTKAFAPFGPRPKLGSNFYLGSPEAFAKPLTSLAVEVEWMDLPSVPFTTHYTGYGLGISSNQDFTAGVSALKDGEWSVNLGTKALFANPVKKAVPIRGSRRRFAPLEIEATVDAIPSKLGLSALGAGAPNIERRLSFDLSDKLAALPDLPEFDRFDMSLRQGFLRFQLANPGKAFGHEIHPRLFTETVLNWSNPPASGGATTLTLPKDPYTPTIRSIGITYSATEVVKMGADDNIGQVFHLHPFGHRHLTEESPFLIHPLSHQAGVASGPFQGALYIGLDRADPGSTLSLLLQAAVGTEDSSLDPPSPIVWSYLGGNAWRPLDDNVIADDTNGLLAPGIVQFALPADLSADNTLLPGGLSWLRLSIPGNHAALPMMIGVHAQAFRATFSDRGNDPAHLALPLPAGEAAKFARPMSAVKKVGQPYESFAGRRQEAPAIYHNRVSERLRHKRRAITLWDYERLVLQEFPDLYRVKCLNHTRMHPAADATEVAPGHVSVIVIPDFRNKRAGDRFRPRVSNATRAAIRDFLGSLNCPFANLRVANPAYQAIRASCQVRFRDGYDQNHYRDRLGTEIDHFLAPWVFETGRPLDFGGALHRSALLKFIEDRPYVDFITDLALAVWDDAGTPLGSGLSEIRPTTGWGILTSRRDHAIGFNVCATSSGGGS